MTAAGTDWIGPSEAARVLDLSITRVHELADQGKIKMQRTALGRLIERASCEEYARERAER